MSTANIPRSQSQQAVEVSVVIPCLNEERSIGACVERAVEMLNKTGLVGEVVVADNGSTDRSAEIATSQGARVVSIAERGYGSAIRGGIEASRGEFIVLGDADGQHDFSMFPEFVAKLARRLRRCHWQSLCRRFEARIDDVEPSIHWQSDSCPGLFVCCSTLAFTTHSQVFGRSLARRTSRWTCERRVLSCAQKW